MKHIKLYEELLKDLRGLGIAGPRVIIKLYKSSLENRKNLEEFADILFPTLENKERRIEYQDIADVFLEEDYKFEMKIPKSSVNQSVLYFIDGIIHKYVLKNLHKKDIDMEMFINDLVYSFTNPAKVQLIIDGDIKISKEK